MKLGFQKRHPHPEELGKFGPKRKWCWLCISYCEGIIHHEFLTYGQMVNKEYYLKVMKRLEQALRRKGWNKHWGEKAWFVKGEKMVAPSWQHCSAFLLSESWFSHKTWDDIHPPASILTRPCTSRHHSIHRAENCSGRITIWVSRRLKKTHWQSYAVFQKSHSRNSSKTGRNAGSNVWKWMGVFRRGQSPIAPK